jgi:hypothetical protein
MGEWFPARDGEDAVSQQESKFRSGFRLQYPSFQSLTVASATSTRYATQAVSVPMSAATIQPVASSNMARIRWRVPLRLWMERMRLESLT